MRYRWSAGLAPIVFALACGLTDGRAEAQAWDTGRNMFGFAQYYPGSGWSSFYHPDFDPAAFFPTTFGWRSSPPGGQTAPYPAVNGGFNRPAAGLFSNRGRFFRRRHHP